MMTGTDEGPMSHKVVFLWLVPEGFHLMGLRAGSPPCCVSGFVGPPGLFTFTVLVPRVHLIIFLRGCGSVAAREAAMGKKKKFINRADATHFHLAGTETAAPRSHGSSASM